jgi:ketosteroid isomerase-like protein
MTRLPYRLLSLMIGSAAVLLPVTILAHPSLPTVETSAQPLVGGAAAAARVVDAFHAALKAGQIGEAAKLMAADVLIFEAGVAQRSKADYAAEHLPGDAAFEKDATARTLHRSGGALGEVAWIATDGRLEGHSGGKPVDRLTTETMVLRRTSDGWRIVHVHWSSRAAPPGL